MTRKDETAHDTTNNAAVAVIGNITVRGRIARDARNDGPVTLHGTVEVRSDGLYVNGVKYEG